MSTMVSDRVESAALRIAGQVHVWLTTRHLRADDASIAWALEATMGSKPTGALVQRTRHLIEAATT